LLKAILKRPEIEVSRTEGKEKGKIDYKNEALTDFSKEENASLSMQVWKPRVRFWNRKKGFGFGGRKRRKRVHHTRSVTRLIGTVDGRAGKASGENKKGEISKRKELKRDSQTGRSLLEKKMNWGTA